MAKKSKTTRRARAQKQQPSKAKATTLKQPTEAAIIAEGSDEPVVRTVDAPAQDAVEHEATLQADPPESPVSAEEDVRPYGRRALVYGAILVVVVAVLVGVAATLRQQNQPQQSTQQSQSSAKADEILQSGGSVCTNGNTVSGNGGSTDPNSVGMMLQSVPAQDFQSTQTLGAGSDATTLQGATCF